VICSAQSEPQIKAIANGVEQGLKEGAGRYPLAVDGFPTSQWIVIDYGDVMFHIFHEQKRPVYALEDLWSDAPQVSTLQPR
jgi:ribosome-associated protein